jgi:hypothetical protein
MAESKEGLILNQEYREALERWQEINSGRPR